MIDWTTITDDDCDKQVMHSKRCLVVDLPFNIVTDLHDPSIRQMLHEELVARTDEIPLQAVRVGFLEDGTLQFSMPEGVYPTGKMGSPGGATKKVDDTIAVDAEEPEEHDEAE